MTKERFKHISSVYAILIRDRRILLGRRYRTGYEDGNYGLPAGHVDGGETMREALTRKVLEETGVAVDKNCLRFALTMHRWCGDHERADFFFIVEKWSGDPRNTEPEKCDDLEWFPIDQLPLNTVPYIRAAIDCYLKGISYCEFGWGR